jgi:RNA polymerase sigma-70 factor (ECF subfamily)
VDARVSGGGGEDARGGAGDFAAALETFRAELTGHCYRMLGANADAEDAVQETLIRAWRAQQTFEGRSALYTWLHRIATHVCLDLIAGRKRRARPVEDGPVGTVNSPLIEQPRTHWLEPVPDARALSSQGDPARLMVQRESVRLAFVAALQHLPPKQRAALLLNEVLGFSTAEVAETLDTSVAAVNSALQRARLTLRERVPEAGPATLSAAQHALLSRYVETFERYDVDGLTALLAEDATLSMPPYALWLQGPASIADWLLGHGSGCRGSRLVPTAANASPAFAQYRAGVDGGPHTAWALVVLELEGDRIRAWNAFLDVQTLFPRFGLPLELPAELPLELPLGG